MVALRGRRWGHELLMLLLLLLLLLPRHLHTGLLLHWWSRRWLSSLRWLLLWLLLLWGLLLPSVITGPIVSFPSSTAGHHGIGTSHTFLPFNFFVGMWVYDLERLSPMCWCSAGAWGRRLLVVRTLWWLHAGRPPAGSAPLADTDVLARRSPAASSSLAHVLAGPTPTSTLTRILRLIDLLLWRWLLLLLLLGG